MIEGGNRDRECHIKRFYVKRVDGRLGERLRDSGDPFWVGGTAPHSLNTLRGVDEMADEADAIVVGSGINGLVAAAELARAGWSVILLERNAEVGGFIATEERTLPGYLHDTFSSWHPLFVSGPAYAALGELLQRHGLEYRNTDGWVTASVADDGQATLAHRDPQCTAAQFAHAEDRSTYLAMLQRMGDNMASIGGLLGSEVRSLALVRHTFGLVRSGWLRGAGW